MNADASNDKFLFHFILIMCKCVYLCMGMCKCVSKNHVQKQVLKPLELKLYHVDIPATPTWVLGTRLGYELLTFKLSLQPKL